MQRHVPKSNSILFKYSKSKMMSGTVVFSPLHLLGDAAFSLRSLGVVRSSLLFLSAGADLSLPSLGGVIFSPFPLWVVLPFPPVAW